MSPPLNLNGLCDCFDQQNTVKVTLCYCAGFGLMRLAVSSPCFLGHMPGALNCHVKV